MPIREYPRGRPGGQQVPPSLPSPPGEKVNPGATSSRPEALGSPIEALFAGRPAWNRVGFTGSAKGLMPKQGRVLEALLRQLWEQGAGEFHHGDCVGADESAHRMAKKLGYRVVVHPPSVGAKRAFCYDAIILPARPYLIRNRDIVNASDVLLAAPDEYDEVLRSGVWSTVRYARRLERPRILIFPNGNTLSGMGDERP